MQKHAEEMGKLESSDRLILEADNAGLGGTTMVGRQVLVQQSQKPVQVGRVRKGIVGITTNL